MNNRTSKSRILAALALAAGLVLSQGCAKSKGGDEAPPRHEHEGEAVPREVILNEGMMKTVSIEIGEAELRSVAFPVRASGTVGFNERKRVCLTARVPGRIEELEAFVGERVKAGTTLLALYSPEFLAAQAEYLQIAGRLDRAVSGGDAEARGVAERMLAAAARRLDIIGFPPERLEAVRKSGTPDLLLAVTAPFDAGVIESRVVKGDYVDLGAELMSLADLSTVWVLANVFEKDLARVERGSPVSVSAEAYPGLTFSGRVALVHDLIDEETRTVTVRIELANPGFKLKPGLFVTADITPAATEDLLVVSDRAVRMMDGKPVVFVPVHEDGHFEIREVATGRTLSGLVEILGGLKAGDRIVTEGSFALKSEALKRTFERDEHGHD